MVTGNKIDVGQEGSADKKISFKIGQGIAEVSSL